MSTLPFTLSTFCSSGRPELAQGRGPNAGKLDEALKAGREATGA
ncbi:MAG: hypothetical protein PHQ34_16125 [Methanothrix sp.]|nr:hypothetical protein [Methanothrix sp.]